MNRRVPNGTHGGVRGRKSPLETFSYSILSELKEEGHLREIISKIQNMRKDKGFEVADKIKLYLSKNDMLISVVDKFKEVLKKETLTVEIIYNDVNSEYTEVVINGELLNMNVEVIK